MGKQDICQGCMFKERAGKDIWIQIMEVLKYQIRILYMIPSWKEPLFMDIKLEQKSSGGVEAGR